MCTISDVKYFSMKKICLNLLCVAIVLTAFAGCAGINNLLKSGKPDLMYAKAMEYYKLEKWSRASTLFEGSQHYYAGTSTEDSISFFNARCKFKSRDYDAAAELLNDFRNKFGRSVFYEDAEGMYALCFYYLSPGPKRDQTMTQRALVAVNEFMSRFPKNERVETFKLINVELTERMHEKAYLNAYSYYKIGRYKSAIVALKNSQREYPESKHREEIMYLIVISGDKLASNSIAEKQTDRYMSMLDSYYSFISEYPESHYKKELDRLAEDAKDYLAKNNKQDNL